MTNHVHLLVTPSDEHGCSQMMQSLGLDKGQIAYWFRASEPEGLK